MSQTAARDALRGTHVRFGREFQVTDSQSTSSLGPNVPSTGQPVHAVFVIVARHFDAFCSEKEKMRAKLIEAPTIHGVERLRRAELPADTIELAHVGKTLARYLPSKSRHFACAAPCADHPAIDLAGVSEAMATNWLNEAASQASAEALKDAIGKSDGARVAFKALTRTGQTAEAIAQVAREEEVEHIVMGTRGLGGIQGLLLGSVATQVIHLAELPITLIK